VNGRVIYATSLFLLLNASYGHLAHFTVHSSKVIGQHVISPRNSWCHFVVQRTNANIVVTHFASYRVYSFWKCGLNNTCHSVSTCMVLSALHGMPVWTSNEKGVLLSVCQTRALW